MFYCGFLGSLFAFFIIGVSDFASGGGGIPVFGCWLIWRRISSGEGIPGVGVTPGFMPFLSSSGLGIPGVGVAPLGTAVGLAGIPGVDASVIGTGLVDNPGGRLLLSSLTAVLPLELALFAGAEPHAAKSDTVTKKTSSVVILIIKKGLTNKYRSAGSEVASPEGSDGVQTGTGRFI